MAEATAPQQARIDAAISRYLAELTAGGELGPSDLDEIEAHLRSLIDDLRDADLTIDDAIAEATRRMGEPCAIARELTCVRSPFGATLSRGRAWSSAVLLVPVIVLALVDAVRSHGGGLGVELALCAIVALALAARLSWARPIVIGAIGFLMVPIAIATLRYESHPLWLVWAAGTLAFIAPWRRRELSKPGWSLALQLGGMFAALLISVFPAPDPTMIRSLAALALPSCLLGIIGTIVRARWAVAAVILGVVALVASVAQLWIQHLAAGADSFTLARLVTNSAAILAAAIGGVLAWRTTVTSRRSAGSAVRQVAPLRTVVVITSSLQLIA
ncbi:MAG: hypothetical protein AB7O24_05415 [Kofleriaceae bacterium]